MPARLAAAAPTGLGITIPARSLDGSWGWTAAVAAVGLLILAPLGGLLLSIFDAPTEALSYLWRHKIGRAVATTALLCACVSAGTLFFGATTAWVLTRYRLRGERLLSALLILPLAIPSYIHAHSLGALFAARPLALVIPSATTIPALAAGTSPALTGTIPALAAMSSALAAATPFLTAWYVLTFSLAPYVFIISRFAFQRESQLLFDAARVQGIRHPFWRLAVPMARPALIGAVMLVSMEVLNEYGAFVYLGIETVTTVIFKLWFNYYDIRGAAQLSAYLLLAIIIAAAVERSSRRRRHYAQSHSALATAAPAATARGALPTAAAPFAYLYCAVPIVCGVAIPAGALLFWGIKDGLSLFAGRQLWIAVAHTIGIAAAAALLCIAAALALACGRRFILYRSLKGLTDWCAFGYAVPGAIIAIAVLRPAGEFISVASLPLLLFAYMVRYLAVPYHPLNGAMAQQCACTDEVAQSLTPSRWRRIWGVTLPQLRAPMAAIIILIVFDIVKDLPLTIILRPIGLETLALQSFYYASEEQFGRAAPFALVMFAIGVVVVIVARRRLWDGRRS